MQSKPVSPQPYIENAAGASAARPAGKKGEPTNLSEENVGFQPSSDLQALVTDLRALPEVRAEVVADAVRRFTWLVDVFYDQRVKLICSAEVEPELLVVDDRVTNVKAGKAVSIDSDASQMVSAEFARTASRLREMQSREYFARKHASADNPAVMKIN